MIQVISKLDGYWKGGHKNPAHPVYFEDGYLTQAEIDGYLSAAWTPQTPGKPIYISFGVDEPNGEGWTIHRVTERSGEHTTDNTIAHPSTASNPVNNPPSEVIPAIAKRGRPVGSGKK